MENSGDSKKIGGKALKTYILVFVLMIPICLILFKINNHYEKSRFVEQEQVRASMLAKLTEYIDAEENAAKDQFDAHLAREVALNSELLREYVTPEGYTGSRVLPNGFVVEILGDKALIPAGVSTEVTELDRKLIEEGLASGTVRTDSIVLAGETGKPGTGEEYFLSFGRITDTLIYAEMTSLTEFEGYQALYTEDSRKAMQTSDEIYNRDADSSFVLDSMAREVTIVFLMFLILITLTVYALSEQRYVRENILNDEEMEKHDPTKIRKKGINACAVGTIAILIISFLTHAVGQMYQQTSYGKDILKLLAAKYTDNDREEQLREIKLVQENWYVRYGNEMAALFEEKPEAATKENLVKYSDILGTDFIMLFDSKGNETVCNDKYEGFTLEKGLGANTSDFRRLLIGVQSIVHDISMDSVTGLERQTIGVSMKAAKDSVGYGALIMALMPDQIVVGEGKILTGESTLMDEGDILCFIANAGTGEIIYSGDVQLLGKKVTECGLLQKSLQSGYMDYGIVNSIRRFVVTEKVKDSILYYTTRYEKFRKEYLLLSVAASALFLLAALILGLWIFKDYNTSQFKLWSSDNMPAEGKGNAFWKRITGWDRKSPEEKAGMVFYTGLFIMMQMWVRLILNNEITNSRYTSMLDYLLKGDWMRGFNLFALCSVFLILAIANLIITLSSWALYLVAGFLPSKGQTICMLFKSIIKYASIVSAILLALGCFGLVNATVITTLGISSLALSFGAKDLVADILAGIFIVFEETLRVGDVVEYNGQCYTVEEVGMRSTKLSIPPGNHMIISNHELTSVTNMSKEDSVAIISVVIKNTVSLTQLEEIFDKNFPEISKKNNLLKGPVRYYGISKLGLGADNYNLAPLITVSIGAPCEQRDIIGVRMFINREVRLLAEKENIEIV